MRILIVEDEVKIRKGLANLIVKQTGNEIVGEAKNGREGLELILSTNPDLVITDVKMPVMDGLEMLRELSEKELHVHSVILSGYSEFEYAKKAISYGVDDYLLKPLAPEDILSALEKIRGKLEEEIRNQSGKSQQILWKWLQGQIQDMESEFVQLKFDIGKEYILLSGYGWNTLFDERKDFLQTIQNSKTKQLFSDMHCCALEETRELVNILPAEAEESLLGELSWYMERTGDKWVWVKVPIREWTHLCREMEKIRRLYLYGEGHRPGKVITMEDMNAFSEEPFSYPEELEGKIRSAIYREDLEQTEKRFLEFEELMEKKNYSPYQVKEAYLRLTHRIMGFLEDVEKNAYETLEPMRYRNEMSRACTRQEMRRIMDEILHTITNTASRKEDISNYAIKKAISYIRMHYSENISLEEIADKLDITPEYLSALFNREVGVNFTVFLRDFRISHARRLLKSTDKKIYEIAEEVGYTDSKYFNRVFKEKVGVSPREFRQM